MSVTEILVPAPPALPEQEPVSTTLVSALPMLAGMGSMVMMAGMSGAGQSRTLVAAGFFLLSTSAFIGAQVSRQLRQRRRRTTSLRSGYLRQVADARETLRSEASLHRAQLLSSFPPPDPGQPPALAPVPMPRPGEVTFGSVRIGTSDQPLPARVTSLPPEDPDRADAACMQAAADLVAVHRHVRGLPHVVVLDEWDRIEVTGPAEQQRSWARALLCGAATRHAPQDLRIALRCGPDELAHWDWLKWLPHHRSARESDAAAGARLVSVDAAAAPASPASALTLVLCVGVQPSLLPPPTPGTTFILLGPLERTRPSAQRHLLVRLGTHDDERENDVVATTGSAFPFVADACSEVFAEATARGLDGIAAGGEGPARAQRPVVDNDLPSLLGVDLSQWQAGRTWEARSPADTLAAPLGLDEHGRPLLLDLKESAHGGDGPHGLVVGATGSGKSELLRTLVLALAMRHSPDELGMVLVDFKGGATFAGLAGLPHVSALVTNLGDDHALVNRMQDALTGELVRRQELLRASGHASLHDYRSACEAGADLPPVPSLFVCIDEFSELLTARPEFIEVFVAIGRLGRSLGIHLLLASQRIEEGRLRGLESHLSYRIGLRTFSAAESRAAIGVPDAHTLPRTPGVGLVVTGSAAPRRFTAAYVSGPPRQPARIAATPATPRRGLLPFTLLPLPHRPPAREASPLGHESVAPAPDRTTVDLVVDALVGHPRTHAVWLPPLAEAPPLASLFTDLVVDPDLGLVSPRWRAAPGLKLPIGVVDRPKVQRRDVSTIELSGAAGHLVVVGGPRSGKSTLLATVVSGIALTSTPVESQVFLLDFAGGSLNALAGLPHVVGSAARGDDMVTRVVGEVNDLIARRERYFRDRGIDSWEEYRDLRATGAADDGYGEVHVVVDGWGVLRTDHFELEMTLQQWAERGLSFGVHVLVATQRWSDLRSSMRDLLASRVELRLGDPIDSVVDRRAAQDVPTGRPGRGLVDPGLHLLTALPSLDGSGDLDALVEAVAQAWTGPLPRRLHALPERVELVDLVASAGAAADTLVLGVNGHDLAPLGLDPRTHRHLMVRGADRSGRTSVLRTYAREVARTHSPQQAQVVLVDPRGTLQDVVGPEHLLHHLVSRQQTRAALTELAAYLTTRVPGPEVSARQLGERTWWSGADVVVLVDDHDLVSAGGWQESGLHLLAPLLPQAREVGLHVVVAQRGSEASRNHDPLVQGLADLSAPTLLLPGGQEGRRGARPSTPMVPGRAQLLTRGSPARTVQVAWSP